MNCQKRMKPNTSTNSQNNNHLHSKRQPRTISSENTLLCEVTINSIRKCFVFFFHPHLRIKSKAFAYMSRHLHIKSKTSAYTIGTCFRFYMQMRVENNNKTFAYRIYSHLTQQCT